MSPEHFIKKASSFETLSFFEDFLIAIFLPPFIMVL